MHLQMKLECSSGVSSCSRTTAFHRGRLLHRIFVSPRSPTVAEKNDVECNGFRICKIECHLARPIESQARPSWTLESIANYVFIIGDGRRGWDVPYWGYESWRYLRSWFEGDGRKSETGFSSRWTTGVPPRDSHKYSEFAWSNRRTLPTSSTTGPPLNPLAANSPPLPASPITSHPPLQTPPAAKVNMGDLEVVDSRSVASDDRQPLN